MNPTPLANRGQRGLKSLGYSSLCVYVAWNAFWLTSGKIPPSLLYALTGMPCPTTGGTRSFLLLLDGEIHQSIIYNPMTVPIIALLLATLIRLNYLLCVREKVELTNRWLIAWLVVLGLAWSSKLLLISVSPI